MPLPTLTTVVNKGYGCTELQVNHYTYEWTIKAFEFLPQENGEGIWSPNFRVEENDQVEWGLQLFPKGDDKDSKDYVSLFLYLNSQGDNAPKITVHVKLSILTSNSVKCKHSFKETYEEETGYGSGRMIERSKLLKSCGSDNSIMVRCTMDIPQRVVTRSFNPVSFDLQKGQMNEQFSSLLQDSQACDVTIIVGEEKFTAHKLILAARSVIFATMFKHKEMEENRKNEVKIEDLNPRTVKAMLEFIYTDEVTNLETLARELLRASDKYQLDRLRMMCERVLYETLTKDNAAEILILSDLHHSHQLKDHVMAFIDGHLFSVMQSESYKKMVEAYPALVNELMYSIAIRRESKA